MAEKHAATPTAVQTVPDPTYAEIKASVRKLTTAQRHTLGRIAMNDDSMVNKRIAVILESKGLIESFSQCLGGRLPVVITRYYVPLRVHMAYCDWASEQLLESDD